MQEIWQRKGLHANILHENAFDRYLPNTVSIQKTFLHSLSVIIVYVGTMQPLPATFEVPPAAGEVTEHIEGLS
jgi:hypothetical protein